MVEGRSTLLSIEDIEEPSNHLYILYIWKNLNPPKNKNLKFELFWRENMDSFILIIWNVKLEINKK